MARSTRTHGRLAAVAICAILTSLLTGCPGTIPREPEAPPLKLRSQTEIDVGAVKDEWLKKCDGLSVDSRPQNKAGALALDYTALVGVAAPCRVRHNALVEYLKPIVERERANALQPAK